jgi:lysophospholipase L1-like esterase
VSYGVLSALGLRQEGACVASITTYSGRQQNYERLAWEKRTHYRIAAIVTAIMTTVLSLVQVPAANAEPVTDTGNTFTLGPASGPAGTVVTATATSPCAKSPDGKAVNVLLTLTDPAGDTKEYTGTADNSTGNWAIPIVIRAANTSPSQPGYNRPGTYMVDALCWVTDVDTNQRETLTTYDSVQFDAAAALTFKYDPTSQEPGQSVVATQTDPCPQQASTAVLDLYYFDTNGYHDVAHSSKSVDASGNWTSISVSVPETSQRALIIDVICNQGASVTYFYDPGTITILTEQPPTSTPGSNRYVAFGDSVPYGHGLANPTKDTKDGLPANQGPSSVAYPSLLAAKLGVSLTNRPKGCSLEGPSGQPYGNLAVSGAPSIANAWTGKDDNCKYPKGKPVPRHKAVVPEETTAAHLKSATPALVTIQAGADDINFAGCLEAILGLPAQAGAHTCLKMVDGDYRLTNEAKNELISLEAGLLNIINGTHRSAPNAQIVLLNYYQILPKAGTRVSGTSPLCRNLRAAAPDSRYRRSIRAQADFVQQKLNNVIAKVARQYPDVLLVDLADAYDGYEMCTTSSVSSPRLYDEVWNAAHPTAHGHRIIADKIAARCAKLSSNCVGRSASTIIASGQPR